MSAESCHKQPDYSLLSAEEPSKTGTKRAPLRIGLASVSQPFPSLSVPGEDPPESSRFRTIRKLARRVFCIPFRLLKTNIVPHPLRLGASMSPVYSTGNH